MPNPETEYTYTPDNQPDVTSLPQSSDITYTHDPVTGKLSTVVTPEATYTFVHDDEGGEDDTGQLVSVEIDPVAPTAGTNMLTYTYDGDLMTGESLTGDVTGSVTWGYDSQGRLDEETAAMDTVAYGYDSQGRLTPMGAMTATYVPTTGQLDTTTLSDVVASYSYDAFGDLSGILYEDGGSAVYEVTYTRDSYGRVETKSETLDGTSTLRCYEYDDADRLADVYDAADSMGCTGANVESYSYDANGNRSAVTNSAGTIGAGGIVTDNQDRLLTHGDMTYVYNEDGQMTSRTDTSSGDVWQYTYDAMGNLLEVDPPGMTGTVTYTIDPRNRRVGRSVDGVMVQRFLYGDQLNPIAELDGSGALVSRFVYGTSDHVPDYMVRGGVTYRFLTDQLGSVVGVLNLTSGLLAQSREYDAYGRIVGGAGTVEAGFSQPFGFAGGLWDEATGLVRFGARDYRPEVGSWAAKDPLRFGAGDTGLYSYCFADPVGRVDSSGLKPRWPKNTSGAFLNPHQAAQAWARKFYNPRVNKEICAPLYFFEVDFGRGKKVKFFLFDDEQVVPGTESSCSPFRRFPGGVPPENAYGDCHTHAAASDDFDDEKLSPQDRQSCKDPRTGTGRCWLFTPGGTCQFYSPGTGVIPCPGWVEP